MTVKYTLPRFPNHKWVFYFIQIAPNIHSELCRFGSLNCVTRISLKVPDQAYRRFLIIQLAPIYPTYECTSRCLYKHTRTHILNTELVSIEVLPRLTRPACRCCIIRQIGKENLKQYLNMNSNQRRRGIRRFDGSPSRIAHTVFAIPSLPYTHTHPHAEIHMNTSMTCLLRQRARSRTYHFSPLFRAASHSGHLQQQQQHPLLHRWRQGALRHWDVEEYKIFYFIHSKSDNLPLTVQAFSAQVASPPPHHTDQIILLRDRSYSDNSK